MRFYIRRWWLYGVLVTGALPAVAQNNAIFKGGSGDGSIRTGYTQNSLGFWKGGDGDGYARARYNQASASIFSGGEGDGYSRTGYLQSSGSIYKGGDGDGYAKLGYKQNSPSFWKGGAGDGWASRYKPDIYLPVNFGAFTVVKKNATAALLNWNTVTEVNASHFEIERSADAVNFTYLGRVAAHGNSTVQNNYSYTDAQVMAGANYYRLKLVDKDGKSKYTPTRMLQFDGHMSNNIKLFPNPASSLVTLELPATMLQGKAVINMMDIKGNVVKHWKISSLQQLQLQLNISGLTTGVYLVHVIAVNGQASQKLVVQ